MRKVTIDEFIKRAEIVHKNKYNYSDIIYINVKVNIFINCPIHGKFEQRPQHHLAGHGCDKCARILVTDLSKITKDKFLLKSKKIHDDKYDYSLVSFDFINSNDDKVKIICKKHGEFNQIIRHHLSGSGCPFCIESKGELKIANLLNEKNITFIRQYRIVGCKFIKPLPFDFYLPEHNILIEYQGEQHFRPVEIWGGENGLKNILKRDKIKKEYCESNGINLIIIKYNEKIKSSLKFLISK